MAAARIAWVVAASPARATTTARAARLRGGGCERWRRAGALAATPPPFSRSRRSTSSAADAAHAQDAAGAAGGDSAGVGDGGGGGAGGGRAPYRYGGWPYEAHHRKPDAAYASRLRCPRDAAARKDAVDAILRVDQAGERAAVRIYEGQLAALRLFGGSARPPFGAPPSPPASSSPSSDADSASLAAEIREMKATEEAHLSRIESLVSERRARPTALMPLWDVCGFALGAATAALGGDAAMACTVAVEDVIGEHYNDQIRSALAAGWGEDDPELLHVLRVNRDEELAHREAALAAGAERAPAYAALTAVIKAGCRVAIEITKRV